MDFLETVRDTATNVTGTVQNYFEEDRATTRKKMITTCTILFLTGIIIGFVFAPIKKGFYFNISDNGNVLPDGAADTPCLPDKQTKCNKEKKCRKIKKDK